MSAKGLRQAAHRGDAKGVAKILRQDAALIEDWKPLMDACYRGHGEVVETLLRFGADPDTVSKTAHRYRPLHRVIEYKKTRPTGEGHDACVKALIDGGADLRARGGFEQVTALQMAAKGGETRFIPPLKKAMGPLDIFHNAVLADDKGVARLLKKDAALASAKDENGWPPMMFVAASKLHQSDVGASERLVRCAEMLIEAGAEPNPVVSQRDSPLPALYYATGAGNHPALAKRMLAHGADPNDGESIHHCAEALFTECLDLLLEHGGDLNHKHPVEQSTPLYFVLQYGSFQGVSWLLEHGADPNVRSGGHGRTALHAAAERGCNDRILQMLIDHGAKPDVKDDTGTTPADLAKIKGKTRVEAFLKNVRRSGKG